MADYWRVNRKKRADRWPWAALVLVLAAVFFFVRQNLIINQSRQEHQNRVEELAAELKRLEQEKLELGQLIESAEQEVFLERIARERLNLKRPGEQVVVFEVEPGSEVVEEVEEPSGFWSNLKRGIADLFKRQ